MFVTNTGNTNNDVLVIIITKTSLLVFPDLNGLCSNSNDHCHNYVC